MKSVVFLLAFALVALNLEGSQASPQIYYGKGSSRRSFGRGSSGRRFSSGGGFGGSGRFVDDHHHDHGCKTVYKTVQDKHYVTESKPVCHTKYK